MLKRRIFNSASILLATLTLMLVGGCENALTGILQAIEDQVFALAAPTVSPAAGTTMTAHESMQIVFSETIDTDTLIFGGSMADRVQVLGWGAIKFENDTIYISPKTGQLWPSSGNQNLTITCVNIPESGEKPKGLFQYELSWNIFSGVCVDRENGSDVEAPFDVTGYLLSSQGTAWFPKQNIHSGIEKAIGVYSVDAEVRIAGTGSAYVVDSVDSTYDIVLSPGISLTGGYDSATWSFSRPDTTPSIIEDSATSGSNNKVIRATDETIGNDTLISNLTIKPGRGSTNFGIDLLNSAPTIRNITIVGRAGSSTSSTIGIRTQGNGPVIEDCVVFADWEGSDVPVNSIGVHIAGASTIEKTMISGTETRISGGKASDTAIGITVSENGSTISGITVDGGSPSVSAQSIGIYCEDAGALIAGNTIDCGLTDNLDYATGIEIVNIGSITYYPRIEGNTFRNTALQYPAYGIFERNFSDPFTNADPQTVSNNIFSQRFRTLHSSNGYYLDEGSGDPPSGVLIRDLNNTVTIYDDSTINLNTESNVEQVFP